MACDVQDEGFLTYGLLEVFVSSEHLLKLDTFPGATNRVLDTLELAIKVQQIHLIRFFVFAYDALGRGVQEYNIDAATILRTMALQFIFQIFNLSSLPLVPFRHTLQILFQLFQSFLILADFTLRHFLFFAPDLLLEFKEWSTACASRGIHRLGLIAPICLRFFRHINFRPKFYGGFRCACAWWLF